MSRQTRKSTAISNFATVATELCTEENKSKVLVIPKTLLESGKDVNISVVKLRNPKTGVGNMFLFSGSDRHVFNLMDFNEKHRSWFIGNGVQRDGSLVFVTPIDPLFLVLPYLKQSDKFRPLDQMIVDDEFPECVRLLRCNDLEKKIDDVADTKNNLDLKAYRLNRDKCTKWLTSKVENLIAVLKKKEIGATTGSRAATFVCSKDDSLIGDGGYLRYAHGIVSEFLPSDVSVSLAKHLSISELQAELSVVKTEPVAKRPKTEGCMEPLENYCNPKDPSRVTQKAAKLTTAQKALSKVDKSGMKSISSFFAKKTS